MKILSIILLFLLLAEFKSDNKGPIIRIDLLAEPEGSINFLTDIATNVEYVPLQMTKQSIINIISKIIIYKEKVYIKSRSEILCFDISGRFLYKLNQSGRGPEEYGLLIDFDLSSDGKILVILSNKRILAFENSDKGFVFKNSINLKPPLPSKISLVPWTSNILLSIDPSYGTEPSLSILLNKNGDTLYCKPNLYKYKKISKEITGSFYESLHYKVGNNLCFREEFSDTVFCVSKETSMFLPRLIFDSHGRVFPPRAKGDLEYAKSHSGQFTWIYNISEVNRYIIYAYEYNHTRRRVLYDKSNNKRLEMKLKEALVDNICGGPNFDPTFCSEGKYYSVVEALNLKEYVQKESFAKARVQFPNKKEELEKIATSLNDIDNPVLIILTPKN
jgi:hypothetical protein